MTLSLKRVATHAEAGLGPTTPRLTFPVDFLAGRPCTPIATGVAIAQSVGGSGQVRLRTPTQPTARQRELPGTF